MAFVFMESILSGEGWKFVRRWVNFDMTLVL